MDTTKLSPQQAAALDAKLQKLLQIHESAKEWMDKYELTEISQHTFAYKSKEGVEHHICPNCYERKKKSVLRIAPNPPSRLRCDQCGVSLPIETSQDREIAQLRSHMEKQHQELQTLQKA